MAKNKVMDKTKKIAASLLLGVCTAIQTFQSVKGLLTDQNNSNMIHFIISLIIPVVIGYLVYEILSLKEDKKKLSNCIVSLKKIIDNDHKDIYDWAEISSKFLEQSYTTIGNDFDDLKKSFNIVVTERVNVNSLLKILNDSFDKKKEEHRKQLELDFNNELNRNKQ